MKTHLTGVLHESRTSQCLADTVVTVMIDQSFEGLPTWSCSARGFAPLERDVRPLIGLCVMGEIAKYGNDFLAFYDKTAAITAFSLGEP